MGVPDRSGPLQAVATTLIVVAVTCFTLRAYVRARMVKAFGPDDWFMLAATITYILFASTVLIGIHFGTGKLSKDVSTENYSKAMQYWLYCYIWYCWTMIFSKISIAIFLLRIIVERIHARFIYVALFINILSGMAFFLVTLLQCHPVSYFWNKNQDGACVDVGIVIALTYFYSSLNILCDFTFALLPIVIVRGLNMNRKMKIAIIPLLSMGCIASSAVIVRLAYVERFRNPEFLYATVDIAIWSTVEAGLAVSAGSLACVRPLFKILMQRIGWNSEAYYHPSIPLHGGAGGGASGGGGLHGASATIGGSKRTRQTDRSDTFNMASLFSRSDDIDDEDGSGGDNHSVGSASTTKLVGTAGGIMKTSAFTVKVEEREPAPPMPLPMPTLPAKTAVAERRGAGGKGDGRDGPDPRPHPPREPPIRTQLLDLQKPPVPRDPHHPRPHAALGLERDVLPGVQPGIIIPPLHGRREAVPDKLPVQRLEPGEEAGQEALDAEGGHRGGGTPPAPLLREGGEHLVEGGGRPRVGGVDADAHHQLVVPVAVGAVGQDPADLDIIRLLFFTRSLGSPRVGRVLHVDVVGPLEPHGEVRVGAAPGGGDAVVAADGLDDGDGHEVLDEDDGPGGADVGRVVDDGREDQGAGRGDPDVAAAAAARRLRRRRHGEARGQPGEQLGVLLEERVGAGHDLAVQERVAPLVGLGLAPSELL
ncbi:hypothetical protein VMCG_05937 [Cytospora schulzeri]|uniref:Rhodopsin domain-containing protein n=1 Tax=Cytospora schulzeri TaxID=448051 RepID=A0A423WDJ0_9PEZI|nr:hypothetical protein VMCG_05937 [Valsa malicola]